MSSSLNYFNFSKFKDKYLLTNDLGNYIFLSEEQFKKLYSDTYGKDKQLYDKLCEKYFIIGEDKEFSINEAARQLREHKNYLFEGTQLHIFVLTTNCNQNCIYCQASANTFGNLKKVMDRETAEKSVDIALQSPSKSLSFEFQGGEPLMNFEILKHIVEYTKEKNKSLNKEISFNLVSNLTLASDEIIEFLIDNGISIATSIDGDEYVHNQNRPYNGGSSFKIVKEKINSINNLYKEKNKKARVQAIQTTTKFSLDRRKEIIDTYVELEMESIFIRPLTPLGNSKDSWSKIGYTAEEFLAFYRKCCDYIKELNS
ncbi:radical SAM protein, partial [Clostridiaceae bacterium UIB06]|nr:radical SAM protein [Clostridiaceae bacterium UIB06]